MATALARDFDETPPDTLPLAALSLTTDIRAPDTSNIERPLTLLSIPKDIRLLIWDEVFTEIRKQLQSSKDVLFPTGLIPCVFINNGPD